MQAVAHMQVSQREQIQEDYDDNLTGLQVPPTSTSDDDIRAAVTQEVVYRHKFCC